MAGVFEPIHGQLEIQKNIHQRTQKKLKNLPKVKEIEKITHLKKSGGDGAVREFVELILND